MSNVVRFPGPREHVAIEAGLIWRKGEPRSSARWMYWLDFVSPTQGCNFVWDGDSYQEAVVMAATFGFPVIDNVGRRA